MLKQRDHEEPGRLRIRTLIITGWPGVPPMTIEQSLTRLGAMALGILLVAQAHLPLLVGGVVTVVAAVVAERLRPPPSTGFLPVGWYPASYVGPGDWIRDGRWAVRVVGHDPVPAGDPPAALQAWQVTLADGSQVDVAEDQRLLRLFPTRLRGGDRRQPVLEVDGEHAISPRHARSLRRISARQRDLGLTCPDNGDAHDDRDGAK
jgi:hypothetical protein